MSELLPLINQRRTSRDEMNLAEFPLTMLSTRGNQNYKTLEFKDVVKGKNGELLDRYWIITGADKFGLPTASDDEVLLGLLKLTVDEGMRARKVYFTRYELLKILRWTTEGRSYSRLQKALDRLSGVRIKASNAFYDNESKLHSTRNFGIIDGYEINDGREPSSKSSFFIWSEVLFKSFQAGFIKKLDLDFYLDLQSAVSKRLYRYLDKHFWYKSRVHMNLFTLAHEKIGVSRNYRFASSLKQQIDPAIEELIAQGFLAKAEYTGRGEGTEIILYAATQRSKMVSSGRAAPTTVVQSEENSREAETRDSLIAALSSRGIQPDQSQKLVLGLAPKSFSKVQKILDHYDFLVQSNSPRIARSPAGFLFHAVKNWETFALPGDRPSQTPLGLHGGSVVQRHKQESQRKLEKESLEADYLVTRKHEIRRIRQEVEPEMLHKITVEVERALGMIRSQISEGRFKEAVQHGVDERIAKLFAVPDFDEWVRTQSSARKAV